MVTQSRFLHCALLLIFLLQSNRVFGATGDSTQTQQIEESFKRWSLNFHMDEEFSWDQTKGNLVSGQYFFTPQIALRLGIRGNMSHSTQESENLAGTSFEKLTDHVNLVKIYPAVIIYRKSSPIRFYWGTGAILGIEWNEEKTEQRIEDDSWQLMHKTEIKRYNLGLQGIVGAEWRFKNCLFLFMEYNPQLVFRYHQVDDMRTGRQSAQTITLYSNPIGLGIGILF